MSGSEAHNPAAAAIEFHAGTRLVLGPGALLRLGELAREHGGKLALVVSDRGITAAGHVARALRCLEDAGVGAVVFDQVHENPTTADVDLCLETARRHEIDLIVGLGGGSPMDTAKGCNFLLTNGGRMQDYWGRGKAKSPMLPMIAVPTTAGTGSEMQSFALIADRHTHQKMACGDRKALPRVAILDPALAVSQPHGVAACSGLDAIAHATETAVTLARTPLSTIFARESFRLAAAAFPRVLEDPQDLDAQSSMMLAAAMGGIAIENSMLGAAHAAANPLTATFGLAHGHAVSLMLAHVVRYNAADAGAAAGYDELADAGRLGSGNGAGGAALVAGWIERMLDRAGLPRRLGACGVPASALAGLAQTAARQWTAGFNPRPVDEGDFAEMYRAAL